MMTLQSIQVKIKARDYRFSEHAVKRVIERSIDRPEVEEVILDGEVIEEYPDDKYSSSCLIFGKTKRGEAYPCSGLPAPKGCHRYDLRT